MRRPIRKTTFFRILENGNPIKAEKEINYLEIEAERLSKRFTESTFSVERVIIEPNGNIKIKGIWSFNWGQCKNLMWSKIINKF